MCLVQLTEEETAESVLGYTLRPTIFKHHHFRSDPSLLNIHDHLYISFHAIYPTCPCCCVTSEPLATSRVFQSWGIRSSGKCVGKISGGDSSNIGRYIGYPDWGFSWFSPVHPGKDQGSTLLRSQPPILSRGRATIDGVWIGDPDLLTTYIHNS
jgi:hypothetical protein